MLSKEQWLATIRTSRRRSGTTADHNHQRIAIGGQTWEHVARFAGVYSAWKPIPVPPIAAAIAGAALVNSKPMVGLHPRERWRRRWSRAGATRINHPSHLGNDERPLATQNKTISAVELAPQSCVPHPVSLRHQGRRFPCVHPARPPDRHESSFLHIRL